MRYAAPLALVLMAVWLLWSGHYTPLLIGFGVASTLAVVALMARLRALDEESVPLAPAPRALAYLPWLVLEIVKANLDVARRIVDPRLPIDPRVVRVPAGQSTDVGRTVYANSITLTPGTVAMRFEDDEIVVHALTAEAAAGLETRDMERRVHRVEGGGRT